MSNDDDYSPTTVLILLGQMSFDTSGSADIMSVKIQTLEERGPTLEAAGERVKPSSLEAIHVILKSSTVSSLYDISLITTFVPALAPGAECTVHVLGSEDMPVQPADVNEIRVSLLMANLALEQEGLTEGEEGGWTLTARKPKEEEETKGGELMGTVEGEE
jgi:hypothetical protein